MNIKFYQYFYYKNNKNNLYFDLVKTVKYINQKYCDLYNYTYKMDANAYPDDALSDYFYVKKIELIYNELLNSNCDYLVFVDADAAVSNPNIKIEELINSAGNKYELFLSHGNDKCYTMMTFNILLNKLNNVVKEQNLLIKEYWHEIVKKYELFRELYGLSCCQYFFNEGLIIIKNTELMHKFWKTCIDFIPLIKSRWTDAFLAVDGAAIQETLRLRDFQNCFTFLPDYAQGGIANILETQYSETNTFILHNYGDALTLQQKHNMLNELLKNKNWSNK